MSCAFFSSWLLVQFLMIRWDTRNYLLTCEMLRWSVPIIKTVVVCVWPDFGWMSALLGPTTAAPACFGVFAENSRFCLSLSVLVCLCQLREFLLQSVIAYWFLLFNSIYVWVRVKICDEWNLRNWRGFFPLCIFCLCFFFFFLLAYKFADSMLVCFLLL